MSEADSRVERAMRWLHTINGSSRPNEQDVELLAKFNLTDPDFSARVIWKERETLVHCFKDLRSVVLHPENHPSALVGDPVVDTVQEDEANGRPELDISERERMREQVLIVIDNLRAQKPGSFDELSESWVEKLLDEPHGALSPLRQTVKKVLLRSFKEEPLLKALIVEESRTVSPDQFTMPPNPMAHQYGGEIDFGEENGKVVLSWRPAPEGTFAFFRVRSGIAGRKPQLFDEGREIGGGGTEPGAVDEALSGDGVRHYEVWAYTADTEKQAAEKEPVLWASGAVLEQVRELRTSVSGDDVHATWQVSELVDRVEVRRLAGDIETPSRHVPLEELLVGNPHDQHRDGFNDDGVPAGVHKYWISTVATIDGKTLRSAPVVKQVEVHVPIIGVSALRADANNDDSNIFVSWLEPGKRSTSTLVFVTEDPIPSSVMGQEVDRSGLVRLGLEQERQLNIPVRQLEDGRHGFTFDWDSFQPDRYHITVVTQREDRYRVDESAVCVRVGEAKNVRLYERVDEQFLTFVWPRGASFVELRSASLKTNPESVAEWPRLGERISHEDHARYGGVHLSQLESEGCQVAVLGLVVQRGDTRWGKPVIVEYKGLTRLRYRMNRGNDSEPKPKKKRMHFGRKGPEAAVATEIQFDVSPPPSNRIRVVLVSNNDYLPLHAKDGSRNGSYTIEPGESSGTLFTDLNRDDLGFFVRLFVDGVEEASTPIAVLDPDPNSLRR